MRAAAWLLLLLHSCASCSTKDGLMLFFEVRLYCEASRLFRHVHCRDSEKQTLSSEGCIKAFSDQGLVECLYSACDECRLLARPSRMNAAVVLVKAEPTMVHHPAP